MFKSLYGLALWLSIKTVQVYPPVLHKQVVQAWNPRTRRWRQEGQKFKVILEYVGSLRKQTVMHETLSQEENKP